MPMIFRDLAKFGFYGDSQLSATDSLFQSKELGGGGKRVCQGILTVENYRQVGIIDPNNRGSQTGGGLHYKSGRIGWPGKHGT